MPKTSATPQTFKQSPADKQRLATAAKALGASKSLVIRSALEQFLNDLEKQNLLLPEGCVLINNPHPVRH